MLLNSQKNHYNFQPKTNKIFWNQNNIILWITGLIILPFCSVTTFSSAYSLLASHKLSEAPTSIPWIDNEAECLHTQRSWENNKCWDYEHSSTF